MSCVSHKNETEGRMLLLRDTGGPHGPVKVS